ncbi:hypothetical protein NGR_c07440 [Sinorhizobium fredii NGR234]|uniref:Uncharacterized protein n=1 Tax=Sinorhizobium fredii (strain NBRC 101917 / NGR234) TaxID=394 RepID=C3M8J1_SINFN|nr:hypothetical protein NGR_c07440 [Sinorhizobium fredii NGR234]
MTLFRSPARTRGDPSHLRADVDGTPFHLFSPSRPKLSGGGDPDHDRNQIGHHSRARTIPDEVARRPRPSTFIEHNIK